MKNTKWISLALSIMVLASAIFALPVLPVSAETIAGYESTTPISALKVDGATVTAGAVYTIANADDMFTFAEVCTEANGHFAGATVVLTGNIDLNPGWTASATAPARVWTPILLFSGTFDGQGHTISGVYAKGVTGATATANEETCGIFATIGGVNVTVKNLNIENSYFQAAKYVASLAGAFSNKTENTGALVSNVTSSATVVSTTNYAAGIVAGGFNSKNTTNSLITFESCVFEGTAQVNNGGIGGISAVTWRPYIMRNCINKGTLIAIQTTNVYMGGIMGTVQGGARFEMTGCVNLADINMTKNPDNTQNESSTAVGGLIGSYAKEGPAAVITDCVNAGKLSSGRHCTGGLVGIYSQAAGSFTRCLFTGVFAGGADYYSGGMVGQMNYAVKENTDVLTFTDCAYLSQNFTDYYNNKSYVLRGTGIYAGANASTRNIRVINTVSGKDVSVDKSQLNSTQWNNNVTLNNAFQNAGCACDKLTGSDVASVLRAFDFETVWTVTAKGIPVPRLAATLLPQGDASTLDAEVIAGEVDTQNRIITDTVTGAYYTIRIRTQNNNSLTVYRDAALTQEIRNPVRLQNGENIFYFVISTADGKTSQTWTAKITTSGIDPLDADLENDLRYFGRTYSSGTTHYMNWTASGFTFSFKGTGATATFVSEIKAENALSYLKVYVDGKPVKKLALQSTADEQKFVLAQNLDGNMPHTVAVYMMSDNAKSAIVGLTNIHLENGSYLAPQEPAARKIEIIGDSISVGYGNLGTSTTDAWTTALQDGTLTYAALAALAFGADYNVVALSGRGMAMNYGGSTSGTVPSVYDYADAIHNGSAEWDFDSWQPDVIVINLGTNDASNVNLSSETFSSTCKLFLQNVRKKNPNAYIIYAYGFMKTKLSSEIQAVITELTEAGDSKLKYLPLEILENNEMASAKHPTLAAQAKRAEPLIAAIQSALGWNTAVSVAELLEEQKNLPIDTGKGSAGSPNAPVTLPGSFDSNHVITGGDKPKDTTGSTPFSDTSAIPESSAATNEAGNRNNAGCSSSMTGLSIILMMAAAAVFFVRRKHKKV